MFPEIRKRSRERQGITTGESVPDYGRCITIVMGAAQREIMIQAVIGIVLPSLFLSLLVLWAYSDYLEVLVNWFCPGFAHLQCGRCMG
jgi:Na+/H+-translocating membrane pyrophosphatase